MRVYRQHSPWIGRCWTHERRGHREMRVDPSYLYGQGHYDSETAAGVADELLDGLQAFRRLARRVWERYAGFDEHDAKLYVHFMIERGKQSWPERCDEHGPFWMPADIYPFLWWMGWKDIPPELLEPAGAINTGTKIAERVADTSPYID